jgi:hypothetical protein
MTLPFKRAIVGLLFCSVALARNPEQSSAGSGKLDRLLSPHAFLMLASAYKGTVTLAYHDGPRKKDAPTKRNLHSNAFTHDASSHSETDCPCPRLPAVFEAKSINGHGYGGDTLTFSGRAPNLHRLMECWTVTELRETVPHLVRINVEDGDAPAYWYNWFHLDEDAKMHVTLLRAGNDSKGKLVRMEIWKGVLLPQK